MNTDLLGSLSLILPAAAAYTHNIVNGYTMARPQRSKFEIWLVAMVVGAIMTVVASIAGGMIAPAWKVWGQLALAASFVMSSSAGMALTQTSAQAAREKANADDPKPDAPEPDPGTPAVQIDRDQARARRLRFQQQTDAAMAAMPQPKPDLMERIPEHIDATRPKGGAR